MLEKRVAAFSICKKDLGFTDVVMHQIQTGDAPPVKQRAYRLSIREERDALAQIQTLVSEGRIRPSSSAWASPVVMVPKPDGSLRMCVDYRKLNQVTKDDVYPLPYIEDVLDRLGKSSIFSTMDVASGFWQVPMHPASIEKTAFCTRDGLWEWLVMPMGLRNAPRTFQRLMATLLDRSTFGKACELFVDDVCVHTCAWEAHLEWLDKVLEVLVWNGIKLGSNKCTFGYSEVKYLGHIISGEGVRPDPNKVKAVMELPLPQNLTMLQSALGMVGYYRRFIKNYSVTTAPLLVLVGQKVEWKWTAVHTAALNELRSKLVSAPVLIRPDPSKPFILDTDYQLHAVAAVLSQVGEDGKEHPVAYASKSLDKAQLNYSATEGECFGIVWGIEHFRQYLDSGIPFTLRTDHEPLKYLWQLKEPKGRLARWVMRLQGYRFKVEHRAGKQHGNADGLSRWQPQKSSMGCLQVTEEQELLLVEVVFPVSSVQKGVGMKIHS